MDWGSLGKKIADAGAQILGETIPLPGAGMAADLVSTALGTDKDPKKIAEAIDKDPSEAAVKLQRIQNDHKEELKKIQAEEFIATKEAGTARMGHVSGVIEKGYEEGVYWRRGVGWAFIACSMLTVIGTFTIAGYALNIGKPDLIDTIPKIIGALGVIFYCFLVILGVAGYQEGKLGRFLAGDSGGGLERLAKAFRGKS